MLDDNNLRMKQKSRKIKIRHWVLITLLILVILVKTIPGWGWHYTLHVYPLIGAFLSPISGFFPFAIGDLFIALSITWVVLYPIYEIFIHRILLKKGIILRGMRKTTIKKKIVFGRVTEYLLWVYVWFYIAWGLNYSQPNIYHRIGMKPTEVSENKFKDFAYRYADSLNSLSEERRVKSEESNSLNSSVSEEFKEETSVEIQKGYNQLDTNITLKNKKLGINPPFNNNPHAKTMMFSRLSSMAGVTGSMGPFFCEFTLNGDILPHDYPATYAHEFAHFLGIANEGEANFYSYIVCTASDDKAVKFSGYYHIFFHVLSNAYNILGEKEGKAYLKHIRPEIIQLAKSDRKYWMSKRCTTIDNFQDFIFDLYLKGNKVSEGRKSYSGVIGLILSWEEKEQQRR